MSLVLHPYAGAYDSETRWKNTGREKIGGYAGKTPGNEAYTQLRLHARHGACYPTSITISRSPFTRPC